MVDFFAPQDIKVLFNSATQSSPEVEASSAQVHPELPGSIDLHLADGSDVPEYQVLLQEVPLGPRNEGQVLKSKENR